MPRNANSNIKSTGTPKMKSVRWAAQQCVIAEKMNMSKKDTRELWYNLKDYKAFKKDCRDTVKILKETKVNHRRRSLMTDDLCERGLEDRILKQTDSFQCSRNKQGVFTVLEEQTDQRYFGTYSPDFIAQIYREISEPCQEDAYLRGLEDAKEARSLYEVSSKELMKVLNSSDGSKVHKLAQSVSCLSSGMNINSSLVRKIEKSGARCWTPKMA